MISFALTSLEKVINAYLKLDPDTLASLRDIERKTIKIEIVDWHLSFYIITTQKGLALKNKIHQEPDTIISGNLLGLIKTGCAHGKSTAIFENGISISGDTALGEKIQDILSHIDIDWEEHLSNIVGDTLAYHATSGVKKVKSAGKHIWSQLKENIKDYLQVESAYFPTQTELETFVTDVHTLQLDADRLEARIDRLFSKRNLS